MFARDSEFGRGWPVVSAAAVGVGLGLSPLPFYTLGVFVAPLVQEFGWTPAQVFGFAFPIYTIGAFLMSPLIGVLTDRIGARKVALASVVGFGLVMMAMSLNTGSLTLYAVLWAVLAVCGAGTLPITFTRPVASWFERQRGFALGIALIATGMFGTLAKYASEAVIAEAGWRAAYLVVGALPILIALPIVALGFRDLKDTPASRSPLVRAKLLVMVPSVLGLVGLWALTLRFLVPLARAQGPSLPVVVGFAFLVIVSLPALGYLLGNIATAPPERRALAPGERLPGDSLREAVLSWRFGLLALCFVFISYGVGAPIPNLEGILGSFGFDRSDAVALAGLTGLAVLGGRLIGGYLIDRFWAPGVAFVFLASPAGALWLLAQGGLDQGTATLCIMMIGFGAGVEYDFLAYLVSRYFGLRNYSSVYGALYGFFAIGAGFGPGILSRDVAERGWGGNLTEAAVVLFAASLPLLALGKYRYGHDGARVDAASEAETERDRAPA